MDRPADSRPGACICGCGPRVPNRDRQNQRRRRENEGRRRQGTKGVIEKTKDGLSKTGDVMTDGWITTRVHQRFVNEDLLKGSDISVDTSKHVVTLKGTVTGRAGRARAATVAKGTEGVRRVVNRLTVGPKIKD